MHTKDRIKLIKAGFVLYRCSEIELVIKRQSEVSHGWKIVSRHETKRAIKGIHQQLLDDPKAIQI